MSTTGMHSHLVVTVLVLGVCVAATSGHAHAHYLASENLGPAAPDSTTSVTLQPGDIVATHYRTSELFRIDPVSGAVAVISVGGLFNEPSGVAITSDGMILVTDFVNDSVISVHPETGAQTLISSGGLLSRPIGIDMESETSIVVTTFDSQSPTTAVIRIDRDTGAQSVVSTGGVFENLWGIARGNKNAPFGPSEGSKSFPRSDFGIKNDPDMGMVERVLARNAHWVDLGISIRVNDLGPDWPVPGESRNAFFGLKRAPIVPISAP